MTTLQEYLPRIWCLIAHRRHHENHMDHPWVGLKHYHCTKCGEYYFPYGSR